jgi:hypothetical protein
MATGNDIFELAGGEIVVWQDESGVIHLKTLEKHNDPVELNEHEAQELAELLLRLVEKGRK